MTSAVNGLAHRVVRMTGRDPHEPGRVATSLELLFDLTFVVAFGVAGNEAAHLLAEGHFGSALAGFCFAMFAVDLGVDQLLLVRLGLRHRRLGLPAHDHGPDGRGGHPGARAAADVRLHRPGPHAGQQRDGARLRRDAGGDGRPVAARGPAEPGASARLPHLRRGDLDRPARLDRADRRGRDARGVGGLRRRAGADRAGRAGAGRAAGRRHAVARPPHRRALRPAGHHRARRGHHRHGRRGVRGGAGRRAGRWTPRWSRWPAPA